METVTEATLTLRERARARFEHWHHHVYCVDVPPRGPFSRIVWEFYRMQRNRHAAGYPKRLAEATKKAIEAGLDPEAEIYGRYSGAEVMLMATDRALGGAVPNLVGVIREMRHPTDDGDDDEPCPNCERVDENGNPIWPERLRSETNHKGRTDLFCPDCGSQILAG